MLICTYEDRPPDFLGIRLLVSSLERHLPGVPVHVASPKPDPVFESWLRGRPNVTLDRAGAEDGLQGWNSKAGLLLRLLSAGHREVIWIDSDVIVAGDFRGLISDDSSLVVTQELGRDGRKGNRLRTLGWGLPLGRTLPYVVNSALLRVTPVHRELLTAWIALLKTTAYQEAQRMPFGRRPIHMISDQDVLGALLGSQEFAHLPVKFLRRGRDIIHDFGGGYAPADRIANLFRWPPPPLVHVQGAKPWRYPDAPRFWEQPARYYRFTQVESSPYPYLAREYRHEFSPFPACLEMRSLPARVIGALTGHNPHLHGLPHAILDNGVTLIRQGSQLVKRMAARSVRVARDGWRGDR